MDSLLDVWLAEYQDSSSALKTLFSSLDVAFAAFLSFTTSLEKPTSQPYLFRWAETVASEGFDR